MKRTHISYKHTLKEYSKKYEHYPYKLIRFTRYEVEKIDKDTKAEGQQIVLKGRHWWFIDDIYYEVPKKLSFLWFFNLGAAAKITTSLLTIGILGGAGYGTYFLVDTLTRIHVIVTKDEAKLEGGLQKDKSLKAIISSKLDRRVVESVKVSLEDIELKDDEYTYDDVTGEIFISSEVIAKYNKRKIIIDPTIVDGLVTNGQMKKACAYFTDYSNRNYRMTVTEGEGKSEGFIFEVNKDYVKYGGGLNIDGSYERLYENFFVHLIYVTDVHSKFEEKVLEIAGFAGGGSDIGESRLDSVLFTYFNIGLSCYDELDKFTNNINKIYNKDSNNYIYESTIEKGEHIFNIKASIGIDNRRIKNSTIEIKEDEQEDLIEKHEFEYDCVTEDPNTNVSDAYNMCYPKINSSTKSWELKNIQIEKEARTGQQLYVLIKGDKSIGNIDFSTTNYTCGLYLNDSPQSFTHFENHCIRDGKSASSTITYEDNNPPKYIAGNLYSNDTYLIWIDIAVGGYPTLNFSFQPA